MEFYEITVYTKKRKKKGKNTLKNIMNKIKKN